MIFRNESRDRERIVEMLASFYVAMLTTGDDVSAHEIDVLYSLLENLFRHEVISWENYLRQIVKKPIDFDEVLAFLNKNLITLDKIRILLSLIVLANSDNHFTSSEVTKILELSKRMNVETEGLMSIIDAIEYGKSEPVSISGFRYFAHTEKSIFRDYLLIGRDPECSIMFQDKKHADFELLIVEIDRFIFIGTSSDTAARINDITLQPRRIYTFPEDGVLKIGSARFRADHLRKIYAARETDDIIDFKSIDYNFKIINHKNHYSILIYDRTVYKNGKQLPHHKEVPVYFDDVLQIKGYEPFNLLNVIERREEIGVTNLKPSELFINFDNDYFSIARQESHKSFARISIDQNVFTIHPPRKVWDLFLNNQKLEKPTEFLLNTDIFTLNKRNFRINNFLDIVEIPFEVEQIGFRDIKHFFKDGNLALDGVSFEANRGELIAILGQSGCGKSTLLKSISGEIIPTFGSVEIDNKDFYTNLSFFTQHIGYVPQEDLLFSNLTVYENLLFRGNLQMPQISKSHIDQKIGNILSETNLLHRRNVQAGDVKNKMLSGGERKRLNIALELLFEPSIIICDEPTSGLSSRDSEQIVKLLKELTVQGKIVIITIHQPNPDIFFQFDRILLMDQGGKQIYFGAPEEAFSYFDTELDEITVNREGILRKHTLRMPEYMYDIIAYPEYNKSNEVTYIQTQQNIIVKRKFPPDYWKDKFKRKMLFDLMKIEKSEKENPKKSSTRKRHRLDMRGHFLQLKTFLVRNILTKLRNRSNMFITFMEAPLLAFLLSFILRLAPTNGSYSYAENINIGIYLYISVIVFVFLGLSNSIEEILSERRTILREKMLNLRTSYFILTKLISLSIFALAQVLVYYFVSALFLEIRGVFLPSILYFFAASFIGFSIGMLISSFIHNSRAIINILPVVLVPQIVFGGAIIEYERMNRQVTFIKGNPIPEVVQVMPSKWLFEGIYTAYAKMNPFDSERARLKKKRLTLKNQFHQSKLSVKEYDEARYDIVEELEALPGKYPRRKYVNEMVTVSVDVMNGKFLNENKNVFLSSYKRVFGETYKTYWFNLLIIGLMSVVVNAATLIRMKFFYKE